MALVVLVAARHVDGALHALVARLAPLLHVLRDLRRAVAPQLEN